MASFTENTWAAALLTRGGWPVTAENVRAIVAWEKAEGGHFHNDARYNPLNTTQPMPGAGNTGSQGNIKVYTSWTQGLDATVKTINNGNYPALVNALKSGRSAQAVVSGVGNSPWGTNGSLLAQTLKSTNVGSVRPSANVGVGASGSVGNNGVLGTGLSGGTAAALAAGPLVPGALLVGAAGAAAGGVTDAASDALDTATAIPRFVGKLGVIFDAKWWLRVGKIFLGMAALIAGVVFIGKEFAATQVASIAKGAVGK